MKPITGFRRLLADWVQPVLTQEGYVRSGYTFVLAQRDNWGLINFQKSDRSSASEFRFAVNIAVASRRILSYVSPSITKPDVWDCQWRIRLGTQSEMTDDHWFSITEVTAIESIGLDIAAYIKEFAVRQIQDHLSDYALRDLWLTGVSPSLTKFERLKNLLILLRAIGPQDKFEATAQEFIEYSRGKPIETTAQLHLDRLQGQMQQHVGRSD